MERAMNETKLGADKKKYKKPKILIDIFEKKNEVGKKSQAKIEYSVEKC